MIDLFRVSRCGFHEDARTCDKLRLSFPSPAMSGRTTAYHSRSSWSLLGLLFLGGCLSLGEYQVGVDALYPQDIRTVSVQIFESYSYRRFLGERLTEAVVKEIESRTPYKVVDASRADAVLSGTIIREQKSVLVESPFDDAREIRTTMSVLVKWHRRNVVPPIPPSKVVVNSNKSFVPETGQSLATAQQAAIEDLAAKIVDLMEIDPLPGVDGPPPLVVPQQ